MGAASWKMSNSKLVLGFLTAFRVTIDHRSLQKIGWAILLRTWKTQGPEEQAAKQWTGPYDALLTAHSSLKLMGIKPCVHHTDKMGTA